MGNEKIKIGFVGNLYYTPKGHSYVVKDLLDIFKGEEYETHMYRIYNNPVLDEFPHPDTLRTKQSNIIPKKDFENWLDKTKPDYCVFTEYQQWWDEDHDKVEICKERGIKTLGFIVWEKLNWDKIEHYKKYTHIMCPTKFQMKLMRSKGLYNAVYTPWGVNLKEIDAVVEPVRNDGKVVFFHCAGSGGVGDRKNTDAIIKAYKMIQDETTDLKITHLSNQVFSKNEIISFTKYADVVINTSKWDSIGLNSLESNACSKPIFVVDMNPVNELVIDRTNGMLIKGEEGNCEHVTCPSYDVDIDDLAQKMGMMKQKIILDVLKKNARNYAEQNFDWEKNKKHILKLIR